MAGNIEVQSKEKPFHVRKFVSNVFGNHQGNRGLVFVIF